MKYSEKSYFLCQILLTINYKGLVEHRWITSFTRPVQVSHRVPMFMAIKKTFHILVFKFYLM